jgi:hypothetical protein
MATRSIREPRAPLGSVLMRPIEWAHGQSLRLLEWFNQERWTLALTLLALVLANLVVLFFFLQGQDNRAIASVILMLLAPLAFLLPTLSVTVFIVLGAGLFGNVMYFALGPGQGTGIRVLTLTFGLILTARAAYEYLRTPPNERPRLTSWLITALLLYWVYHMTHVSYIYLFKYNDVPPESIAAALGMYRPGLFRYFDYHILWIGIIPIIILLRDFERFKQVAILLGTVMAIGLGSVVWEYFAPLPAFFKIMFQLRAAGETAEGYRVRDPAALYLFLTGFFYAIYMIGFLKGYRNFFALLFVMAATFGVLITKNRILWAGILVMLPIALLWKPPQTLVRQLSVLSVAALVFLAMMLYPPVHESVSRIAIETVERWNRNYAFGGDPRLDPSYQFRERERESWEATWAQLTWTEKLFGRGLETGYGYYVSVAQLGGPPTYDRTYIEKVHMHFAWLGRLLRTGYIGVILLGILLIAFFASSIYTFLRIKNITVRAAIVGVVGGTVGVLFYDSLHTVLSREEALPVILMWSILPLAWHWQRTGQLDTHENA